MMRKVYKKAGGNDRTSIEACKKKMRKAMKGHPQGAFSDLVSPALLVLLLLGNGLVGCVKESVLGMGWRAAVGWGKEWGGNVRVYMVGENSINEDE